MNREFWVKPGVKHSLESLVRRLEDNIKMDLHEIGCEVERQMELVQDCVQWQTWC
jgi:hypothetical protein